MRLRKEIADLETDQAALSRTDEQYAQKYAQLGSRISNERENLDQAVQAANARLQSAASLMAGRHGLVATYVEAVDVKIGHLKTE